MHSLFHVFVCDSPDLQTGSVKRKELYSRGRIYVESKKKNIHQKFIHSPKITQVHHQTCFHSPTLFFYFLYWLKERCCDVCRLAKLEELLRTTMAELQQKDLTIVGSGWWNRAAVTVTRFLLRTLGGVCVFSPCVWRLLPTVPWFLAHPGSAGIVIGCDKISNKKLYYSCFFIYSWILQ